MSVCEVMKIMYEKLQEDFIKKGCNNRKSIAIATQVYLELSEVKRYWDVEYHYSSSLGRLYFTARKKKNEYPLIFIPVEVSEGLSFHNFQEFFQLCDNSELQTICLAIVNSDSTCIFYQMSNSLVRPTEISQKSKDQNQKLGNDLKKHRKLLEQAALYGIPITLPKTNPLNKAGTSGT
ncbi:hypothetical protein ILUMI_00020 [Ignelater luminosus]|uniref:tRNA-splicing endonuclease subunit Sen15 domain-containing protein n=1 Tax=Ignelater luminosus TaxID=2038154 RepID=A0A8K0GLN8_IGNLU|nr:hypothetical protein ILUMI_00020 [Ignelater luminosus]